MKKIKILLFLCIGFLQTYAQNQKKHEISIGYGGATTIDIVDGFEDLGHAVGRALVDPISTSYYKTDTKSIGAFHSAYRYQLSNRFTIGGVIAWQKVTKIEKQYEKKSDAFINQNRSLLNFYTLAIESDYLYINKPKFKLYSGIGIGVTKLVAKNDNGDNSIVENDGFIAYENDVRLNYNVKAIGARFGGKFGGFTEIGFGYKGIITAGTFYRF